jgi:TadE-like protein
MSLRGRPGRTHGQAIVEFALIAPLVLLLVLGCVDLSVMGSDKVIAVSAARHGARVASELGGSTLVPANVNSCKGTKPVNQSSTALMVATDQTIVQTVLGAFANASFVARTIVVASKVQALPDEIVVYHRKSSVGQFDGGPFDGGTDRDGQEVKPDGSRRFLVAGSDEYEQYLPSDGFTTNHNVSGQTSRPNPPNQDLGAHNGNNFLLTSRCQGPIGNEAEIGVMVIWTYKPANGIPGPSFEFTEWSVEKEAVCSQDCVTS